MKRFFDTILDGILLAVVIIPWIILVGTVGPDNHKEDDPMKGLRK